MKNIELKVSINNFKQIIFYLKKNGAKHKQKLHQIDTYYKCDKGRLKLREINNKNFQLIFYKRPDNYASKLSNYFILKLSRDQFKIIKVILMSAYDSLNVVKKERDLWIYKHTRIHLDSVSSLGKFLELETVVNEISLKQARKEHDNVISLLDISRFKRYDKSYSDLLFTKK